MDGIGLYIFEYERLRNEEGRSAADIRDVLDRHGVCLADVEVSRGWSATEGDEYESSQRIETLGVRDGRRVRGPLPPGDRVVRPAGWITPRRLRRPVRPSRRPRPAGRASSGCRTRTSPTRPTPSDLVRLTDRPNAGYCVDIWHHTRGANDMAMITALEPDRVFSIQMNDGALVPANGDYKTDCLANRVPPGDGEFDCVGFIRTLVRHGCQSTDLARGLFDGALGGAGRARGAGRRRRDATRAGRGRRACR